MGSNCAACVGSEADPRRHAIRDPASGELIMVYCSACAARVDAELAAGRAVRGIGLGGACKHCNSTLSNTTGAVFFLFGSYDLYSYLL